MVDPFLFYYMPVVRPKVISRRVVHKKPHKLKRTLNLREFYEKKNKCLIVRGVGGLGDILMHRMMFEDFKLMAPDCELTFACPTQYHDAVIDHPFIDHLVDCATVNKLDYMISYNTTTACGRYEMRIAPLADKHRSDIWAAHCGLELKHHNMHIRLTDEEKEIGRQIIEKHRDREGPSIAVCPVSAMKQKDLTEQQLLETIEGLHKRGLYAFGLHIQPIFPLVTRDIPTIFGLKLRQWMSVLNQVDYVVSVDTSAFHCAGGMGKPLVGIFTFADGMVYGQHFDFELVQFHRKTHPEWICGPCYNWGQCPKSKDHVKPCLTQITSDMILQKVDRMIEKWPK